jgi:hypothetical protein
MCISELQKINDQGIALKNTTIFVCTIAYQIHFIQPDDGQLGNGRNM